MRQAHHWISTAVCAGALLAGPGAHAGVFDYLFGSSANKAEAGKTDGGRRLVWKISDFSSVQLVPRESGSPENRQPSAIAAETLQLLLGTVRIPAPKNTTQPLFTAYEVQQLAEPLAQALEGAEPGDDVLLLSTERRNGNLLEPPKAVTARVFVNTDGLQLLVHDTRFDFYDRWRGTGIAPSFSFGSRNNAASVQLQSVLATSRRADWLAFPLTAGLTSAIAPTLKPAAARAPEAAPAAPPPPPKRDAAFYDEQEQRLQFIKRMRDKDLISEPEYQQKRQEILKDM
ncbi:hypothetical protein [Rhodoferax sp.]|uniref:hypothetical protein n=1 Tax=Rhodoferax sp. TaxID=50421 RepID=UPI00374D059C